MGYNYQNNQGFVMRFIALALVLFVLPSMAYAADATTNSVVVDDTSHTVVRLTNLSDGTGEASVLKVDMSTLAANASGRAVTDLIIEQIWFASGGMGFELDWDATTDVPAFIVGGNGAAAAPAAYFDFRQFGGIKNNAGAGKTGDIMLSTIGATALDSYDITLKLKKVY